MSYSRRQLYAMGEPLGDSATYRKVDGGLVLGDGGGGGGGGGQTSQQTSVQELPEWAKPYAQSTLAKAESLTSQPYQTYNAPRIAGFSPLQQQAQQQAAGMAPAEQLGTATSLAQAAGAGALGAGGYQPGQFYGGVFGGRQAAQYMNPYLEQSLAPQIAEAQRQAGIASTQQAGQAVQSGAFGGSRFGLQQAELQRNLGQNISNIVGQGYNNAFTQAQQQFNQDMARRMQAQQMGEQSRQFGANLGLQGLQTGLQAAGTLGNLGQTQYGQQMGINQLQNQYGGQQQALQQQGLSQAYQDFLNQQNYPYKQLGFMSDMIRGLPLGQQTTAQMYQSPGSMLGQLGGLGLGAYGLSRLMAKDGGLMESYADGGEIKGYAGDEGSVTSSSFEESALDRIRYDDNALMRAKQAALARRDMDVVGYIDKLMAENASVRSGLGNAFEQLSPETQDNVVRAAGGGILAFAKGGDEGEYFKDPMGAPDYKGEDLSLRKLFGQTVRAGESYTPGLRGMLFGYDVLPAKEQPKSPAYADSDATERADRMTGTPASAAPTKAASTDGGIKDALKIMAQTHGMPESDLSALYDREYAKISAENKPLLDRLNKAIEKSAGRADKAKSEALPKALAEFGFQWAAAASKPGARFVGSAAAASPTLAASAAESQKAIDKAEDLQNQMQMEQAKFEMALKKGDRATAMQSVSNIRQMQIAMQQLKLQAQQIAQTGAYQQGMLGIHGEELGIKKDLAKSRGITAAASLQQAQNRLIGEAAKIGKNFDDSRQARDLMKQLTEQYGNTDKAKYMYNQQRRAYIQDNMQSIRDQVSQDMQVRSVFDLLGE